MVCLLDKTWNGHPKHIYTNMKKNKWVLITIIVLWFIIGTAYTAVISLFVAISCGWVGYVPDTDELENPQSEYATQVISADGVVMGSWYSSKPGVTTNRVRVEYDEIPKHLVEALVATEDVRYYDHSGIDFPINLSMHSVAGHG